MRRKKVKIDWKVVKRLGEAGCSGAEIASRLGIPASRLYSACQKEKGIAFSDLNTPANECGNSHLREAQYNQALAGDCRMLIHLGKHRLGQKDDNRTVVVPMEIEGKFEAMMKQLDVLQGCNSSSSNESMDPISD